MIKYLITYTADGFDEPPISFLAESDEEALEMGERILGSKVKYLLDAKLHTEAVLMVGNICLQQYLTHWMVVYIKENQKPWLAIKSK